MSDSYDDYADYDAEVAAFGTQIEQSEAEFQALESLRLAKQDGNPEAVKKASRRLQDVRAELRLDEEKRGLRTPVPTIAARPQINKD